MKLLLRDCRARADLLLTAPKHGFGVTHGTLPCRHFLWSQAIENVGFTRYCDSHASRFNQADRPRVKIRKEIQWSLQRVEIDGSLLLCTLYQAGFLCAAQ
jgi:hypothetical protein